MEPTTLKTFIHPQEVYRLEYPAHWEQVTQKEGESCGFGPHDRDDVGLWISIMPMSVDTDQLAQELPKLMRQVLAKSGGDNLRGDTNLKHYALIADVSKEGPSRDARLTPRWEGDDAGRRSRRRSARATRRASGSPRASWR